MHIHSALQRRSPHATRWRFCEFGAMRTRKSGALRRTGGVLAAAFALHYAQHARKHDACFQRHAKGLCDVKRCNSLLIRNGSLWRNPRVSSLLFSSWNHAEHFVLVRPRRAGSGQAQAAGSRSHCAAGHRKLSKVDPPTYACVYCLLDDPRAMAVCAVAAKAP